MFYKKKKSQSSPGNNKQHEKRDQVSKLEVPRAGPNKDKKDKENLQTSPKEDPKNKTSKSSPSHTHSPSRNSQSKTGELGGIKVQLREKFSDG